MMPMIQKTHLKSTLFAVSSALFIHGAYADETTLAKTALEPFWIAAGRADILDPPSVNLASIAVSEQNPQWRVVHFIDNGYVMKSDAKTVGVPITVDCASLTVVGGLPQLQPQTWSMFSGWEVELAPKIQKEFDTQVAQVICRVPLSQSAPLWVDVNKALGETFSADHEGPYTEYDSNNIHIDPENKYLRTVTARDTTTGSYPRVEYWRHTFDCKRKVTQIGAHYSFRRSEDGSLHGEDDTLYGEFKISAHDESGGQVQSMDFYNFHVDEDQSPQLIYIFNTVCK